MINEYDNILYKGNPNNDYILANIYGSLENSIKEDPLNILYINNITTSILNEIICNIYTSISIFYILKENFNIIDSNNYNMLIEKYPELICNIPINYLNTNMCINAVKYDPKLLKSIFKKIENNNNIDIIKVFETTIEKDIRIISLINNLKLESILEKAITINPIAIKHIKKKYITKLDQKKKYLKLNWQIIQYIEQSPALCEYALSINSCSICHIKEPTNQMIEYSIKQNGDNIQYLHKFNIEPSFLHSLYIIGLNNNGLALRYIKNQVYNLCLIAVRNNGLAIQYVKKKIIDSLLLEEAINNNPNSLEFISKQTPMLCKLSINKLPSSIKYAKYYDYDDEKKAILYDSNNFRYIKHNDRNIRYALNINGLMLQYVDNINEDYCKIAVNQNPQAKQYIPNYIKLDI